MAVGEPGTCSPGGRLNFGAGHHGNGEPLQGCRWGRERPAPQLLRGVWCLEGAGVDTGIHPEAVALDGGHQWWLGVRGAKSQREMPGSPW